MKNKKMLFIFSLSIIAIILIVAFSYAYLMYTTKQDEFNNFVAACYNVTYSENTEGISLESRVPMSDSDGLKTDPYVLSIKNNCSQTLPYTVNLNILSGSTTSDSAIKIAVNDEVTLLTSNPVSSSTVDNALRAYNVGSGIIEAGKTVNISFKSWMDSNVRNNQQENTIFKNKITVEFNQEYLANKILFDNNLDTLYDKPSTATNGLFVGTGNDNKETYYFKGEPNNYLKIGDLNFRIIRINEDRTVRVTLDEPVTVNDSTKATFNNTGSSIYNASSTYAYDASSFLNKWYEDNKSKLANYIALESDFCNDTSNKVTSTTTNFLCNVTPLKLNVGLMTFNEFYLSGAGNGFLYKEKIEWTMTPATASQVYFVTTGVSSRYSQRSAADLTPMVYPVINLKASLKTTGSGTADDPYVVYY